MTVLKGTVKSAKEHAGMVWFHISTWSSVGWVALSKDLFDKVYKDRLIRQLYSKHNKKIEKKIARLERERRLLIKKEGKGSAVKGREYHIHFLREKLKKDLHMHDLEGKRISLKLI